MIERALPKLKYVKIRSGKCNDEEGLDVQVLGVVGDDFARGGVNVDGGALLKPTADLGVLGSPSDDGSFCWTGVNKAGLREAPDWIRALSP